MTVAELRAALQTIPGDTEVVMMDGHQIDYTSVAVRLTFGSDLDGGKYKVHPFGDGKPLLEVTWPEVS